MMANPKSTTEWNDAQCVPLLPRSIAKARRSFFSLRRRSWMEGMTAFWGEQECITVYKNWMANHDFRKGFRVAGQPVGTT